VGKAEDAVRVVYVAGAGRSGSTLLDRVLGQTDGFFSGGELRYVWKRGLADDRLCGCGVRFSACLFWQRVIDVGFGSVESAAAAGRVALAGHSSSTRVRHLPGQLLLKRSPAQIAERAGPAGDAIGRLYAAVREVAGCRVVVDSSKLPPYGRLLASVPSIDLYVVHLVRDPRATAWSWLRTKAQPDRGSGEYMEKRSALKTALLWDAWNVAAASFFGGSPSRYLLVRYEDFVARPAEVVNEILGMVGHQGAGPLFVEEAGGPAIDLALNHSAAGNPDRLAQGMVELRPDVEWETAMPAHQRRSVALATVPLLGRFGYPLAVRRTPILSV